ncbi:MAG TPA: serine hydrolase domain-containing protein [Azospirillaceae bacterium]|nr:serine hydrolase domain-containing protein [Azospirillaceae bacterium]
MQDHHHDHPSREALDALFQPYNRSDLPGLAVGVAQDGRILYRRGFGLANADAGVVNGPNRPMRIGSTSKQFTCLAVMLLAERGLVDIDADVRTYLPALPALDPPVTLRHLMTHTGGIRDYLDVSVLSNGLAQLPEEENLRYTLAARSRNFPAGQRSLYCNGGYYLLALIVEAVAGTTMETFLRREVFEPAGLYDTVLWRDDRKVLPGQAALHLVSAAGGISRFVYPAIIPGEGAIISTVDDMLRWLAHMRRPVVGTEATWRAMTTPCRYADGTEGIYGFGLVRQDYRGLVTLGHAGGVVGGRSEVLSVPEHRLDVVVIVNRSDVSAIQLARQVIDRVIGEGALRPPRAPDADAAALAGHWLTADSRQYFRLAVEQGHLAIDLGGGPEALERGADGALRFARTDIGVLEMRPGAPGSDGAVTELRFVHCGNGETARRVVDPAGAPTSVPEELRGRFASDEAAAEALVEEAGGEATLTLAGRYGRTRHSLHRLGPATWLAKPQSLPVNPWMTVTLDGAGLGLSTTRTWDLRFGRTG